LQRLGVKLYLGTAVAGETADKIMFKGESLKSKTVVWTAGVACSPFIKDNRGVFSLDKHGKVEVDQYLSAEPNIYVIGDNASTPYSGMAQTALRDADFVADNLSRRLRHQHQKAYRPKQPIYVTPVGYGWAAVLWGKFRFYGLVGWLMRRAADLLAYKDIEPLGAAIKSWLADDRYEEDCPICSRRDLPAQPKS
jgi:NADH dehydrogenase